MKGYSSCVFWEAQSQEAPRDPGRVRGRSNEWLHIGEMRVIRVIRVIGAFIRVTTVIRVIRVIM